MLVRVTCAGVQIGSASLDPSPGLAHARLFPTAGYVLAASAAQVLGYQLVLTRYWPAFAGDFADAVAARWQGGPLASVNGPLNFTRVKVLLDVNTKHVDHKGPKLRATHPL